MFAYTSGIKLLKTRSSVTCTKRPFKVRDLDSQWDVFNYIKCYFFVTVATEKIFVLIYFLVHIFPLI